jgi:putative aldouronate transport system permease protein
MYYRKQRKDYFYNGLIRIVLIVAGLFTLLPFLYVLAISFLSEQEYVTRGVVIPHYPTLANYAMFIKWGTKIQDAYMSTIIITSVGTAIALLSTAMLAYGLSKNYLPGHKFFNGFLVFTMFFGGGMVPTYMVVKILGMLNTYWAIILPMALSVWNTMLMRTFFRQIPVELEESARLDGAGDMRIAFNIIFPLSKASFATIGLFYAVAYWNEWYSALLYLSNSKMYPLQMALRDIISNNAQALDAAKMMSGIVTKTPPSVVVKMTAVIFSIGPILLVYPFVQKYFVRGVTVGSLKG